MPSPREGKLDLCVPVGVSASAWKILVTNSLEVVVAAQGTVLQVDYQTNPSPYEHVKYKPVSGTLKSDLAYLLFR